MSVIEHLEALRRMLIVIIVAWAVTTIAAFFVSGQVVEWLVSRAGLGKAIYLGPGSFVLTRLQVALYIGFIVAAPVVIQQIWWFVSPGLHRHERRLTLPLIVATIFFFGLGVAAALTGPITRGDSGTLRDHLGVLRAHAPGALPLYRALADREIAIAEGRGLLAPEGIAQLRSALASAD